MFIISYKKLNSPKLEGFQNEEKALKFIKEATGDVVIDNIFFVDEAGNVTFYTVVFEGQLQLLPVGGTE